MYKIFMVEDDEIIARSIREHLQAWNYDVCLWTLPCHFLTDTIGAVKSEKYRKYRSSFCPQRQIT